MVTIFPTPAGIPIPFPYGNRATILGDSNALGDTSLSGPAYGDSFFWHVCAISNGRLLYAGNAGIAADTTAQMLARVESAVINITPKMQVCLVMGGTNDARAAVPLATTAANLTAIYEKLRKANIYVIACLIPPNGEAATGTADAAVTFDATHMTDTRAAWVVNQFAGNTITANGKTGVVSTNTATVATVGSWSGGTPANGSAWSIANPYSKFISLINGWIMQHCALYGIPVFNAYSPVMTSTTGLWNATYTTDNLHYNAAGQLLIGQQFNAAGGPVEMLPRNASILQYGALDAPSGTSLYDGLNICPNGLMLSPTGGIAASWGQTGGGAGFTPTNTTGVSGIADNTQVITFTANAGFIGTTINQAAGTFSVGDRLAFACRMKVTNTSSFNWNVKLALTGGTPDTVFPCGASGNMTFPTNGTPFTPYLEMVVPTGTTAISPQFTAISGSGVLSFGQVTVINLTKLGIV